ncbi:clostripain-related cysteine peptidase [Ottowia thiooxydans]|uniref:Peptidase C11 n=1 Tax=Ottowia thiooxydans TaxID=219182 RepID=A0ABV2Q5H8_9BURK
MLLDRRHFLASSAAMLAAGLAACGGGDNDDGTKVRTTVLVYMLGSDLESGSDQATHNLREMLSTPGNSEVRVLITTGGADKVDPKGLVSNWKTVKRFELADARLNELQDLGSQNMDESATLEDFLAWGYKTAPAERYMLMMWDHGGGYFGFGKDENFPDGPGVMSISALANALSSAQKTSGIKLDYIGFDACLMATVEVAHRLQPYARFLGASQELEPGSGWDWQANTQTLTGQPDISMADFGRASAEAFLAKQKRESGRNPIKQITGLADYSTFSIMDMEKIPALMQQIDVWARAMLTSYNPEVARAAMAKAGTRESAFWPPLLAQSQHLAAAKADTAAAEVDPTIEHFKRVAQQRLRAISFGNESIMALDKPQLNLVDLGHFAALLAAEGIASAEQKALQEALLRAVHFNAAGPRAAHATGLSIYFPKGQQSELHAQMYASMNMPAGYLSLVQRHVRQVSIKPSIIEISPLQVSTVGVSVIEANIASLYGVEDADLMLVQTNLGGPARLIGSLPIAGALVLPTGIALFDTDDWLLLDGQPLLLETLRYEAATEDSGPAYSLGAPVLLKRAGGEEPELSMLIVRVEKDEDGELSMEIQGLQNIDLDDVDAPADRVDSDLSVGDVLTPVHLMYDLERNKVYEKDGQPVIAFGEPITLTEDSGLASGPLPSGQHQLCLMVTDTVGEDALSSVLEFARE